MGLRDSLAAPYSRVSVLRVRDGVANTGTSGEKGIGILPP